MDTYTSLDKQYLILNIIFEWYEKALQAITKYVRYERIVNMPVLEEIGRLKYVQEVEFEAAYQDVRNRMNEQFDKLGE